MVAAPSLAVDRLIYRRKTDMLEKVTERMAQGPRERLLKAAERLTYQEGRVWASPRC